MLDGIHSGEDRVLDRLRSMRVGRHLAAQFVGLVHDRFHLLQGVLGSSGLVAFRHHTSRCTDLNQVHSVLDVLPYFRASRPRPVGDALRLPVILRRKQIFVAVAAGDAEWRTGDQQPRSIHVSRLDAIAKRDVGIALCADVPNRGKPRQQCHPCIADAGQGLPGHRNTQAPVSVDPGIGGEVIVNVDQSGQTGQRRQVNPTRARRDRNLRHGASLNNPLAVRDYQRSVDDCPACRVQ
jgi:hypothetical protein